MNTNFHTARLHTNTKMQIDANVCLLGSGVTQAVWGKHLRE